MPIEDPTAIPETRERADEYLREADDLWSNHRTDEAVQLYWAVIQSSFDTALPDKREGEIMFRVGQTAEHNGDNDRAFRAYYWGDQLGHAACSDAYRRLSGESTDQPVDPATPPATTEDAVNYTRAARDKSESDPDAAIAIYEAILRSSAISPGHSAQTALELGMLYQSQGSHDAAYQMFHRAVTSGSDEVRASATKLLAQYQRQDGTDHDDLTTSGQPTDEQDAGRYLQAAADSYYRGDTARAEALAMIVTSSNVSTDGQKGGAHFYLGSIAYYAGNYDVARTHLTNAQTNADEPYRGWARQMLEYRWQEN